MIKNIIFDMGNVLLRYDPAYIAENIFKDKNKSKEICKIISCSKQWRMLDEGKITDEQAILQLTKKYSNYKEEICNYMQNWINFLPGFDETHEIVKTLRDKGYNLHLLSNASVRFYDYYKRYPVFNLFDSINISAELKVAKPDTKIYEIILEKYNLCPCESLFIDDSKDNINSAKELGFNTYLFSNAKQLHMYLLKNKII